MKKEDLKALCEFGKGGIDIWKEDPYLVIKKPVADLHTCESCGKKLSMRDGFYVNSRYSKRTYLFCSTKCADKELGPNPSVVTGRKQRVGPCNWCNKTTTHKERIGEVWYWVHKNCVVEK